MTKRRPQSILGYLDFQINLLGSIVGRVAQSTNARATKALNEETPRGFKEPSSLIRIKEQGEITSPLKQNHTFFFPSSI